MQIPLSFWDASIWLAATAIVLLVTAELLSPSYGQNRLYVNRNKLRNVALAFGVLFLATVAIRIIGIIQS